MPDVVKHAWTHRSRGLGGTDPVPPDLPFIVGTLSTQAVTTTAEAQWDSVFTSDPDSFRYDPGDPAGLLFQRDGTYQFKARTMVGSGGGTAAIQRHMFVQSGVVSGGPFGGSAIVDSAQAFYSGYAAVDIAFPWSYATTLLWESSMRSFFSINVLNPGRASLVLGHSGSNYTALDTSMYIIKVSSVVGVVPPLPET